VELAIGPASAADLAESDRLDRRWEDAFLPMRGMWLRDAGELAPLPAGVELEGEGLVVSAAKPAEDGDGMILRCCNSRGAVTAGRWRLQPPPRYAERSAADERAGETIPVEADGSVPFGAGPREIVTVRIR
jgi:alpha-mannosidase